ncbi:uncharacterized protein BJ171DRAFT_570097 [Polychytrium aggregatum]|uniref:uncharacterized protein n=1 Tax=Polychytrium aggregatum TaxID=110093 RepID=UPI0022FF1115|nr:uncharacterized protein BJ171DRAFT_570097 [Polychytrium aggregatum]KAI9201844.1 hypothetical protein BJ171DRAFT_570097 [Polychytrium aggregatum]
MRLGSFFCRLWWLLAVCSTVSHAQSTVSTGSSQVAIYADTNSDGSLKLRLHVPNNLAYFAVGTGSSMKGSDIVVVWQNSDGSVVASFRHATGHSLPQPGDQSSIAVLQNDQPNQVAVPANTFVITVQVPSSWGSLGSFIWAYVSGSSPNTNDPTASFSQHSSRTRGTLSGGLFVPQNSFAQANGPPPAPSAPPASTNSGAASASGSSVTASVSPSAGSASPTRSSSIQPNPAPTATPTAGSGQDNSDDSQADPPDFTVVHGYLMGFAWMIACPAGILVAQFCKKSLDKWWFRLHQLFMFVGCGALCLTAFILIFYQKQVAGDYHFAYNDTGLHGLLGLIITIAMLGQIILGIVIDRMYDKHRTSVPVRDKAHWHLGRLTTLLSIINIVLGCILYGVDPTIWLVIGLILAAWLVVFVLLAYSRHLSKSKGHDFEHLPGSESVKLLRLPTTGDASLKRNPTGDTASLRRYPTNSLGRPANSDAFKGLQASRSSSMSRGGMPARPDTIERLPSNKAFDANSHHSSAWSERAPEDQPWQTQRTPGSMNRADTLSKASTIDTPRSRNLDTPNTSLSRRRLDTPEGFGATPPMPRLNDPSGSAPRGRPTGGSSNWNGTIGSSSTGSSGSEGRRFVANYSDRSASLNRRGRNDNSPGPQRLDETGSGSGSGSGSMRRN